MQAFALWVTALIAAGGMLSFRMCGCDLNLSVRYQRSARTPRPPHRHHPAAFAHLLRWW